MPKHIVLHICSYLTIRDVLYRIRPLCYQLKAALVNSGLARSEKVFKWMLVTNPNHCLLHQDKKDTKVTKLDVAIKKRTVIL